MVGVEDAKQSVLPRSLIALGLLRSLHRLVERSRHLGTMRQSASIAPALISDSSTRLFKQPQINLLAELPQARKTRLPCRLQYASARQ